MDYLRYVKICHADLIRFISSFLGIQAETIWAIIVDLASKPMPARKAFHLFPVGPADFILGIIAQENR
jgi:hypothetical protein